MSAAANDQVVQYLSRLTGHTIAQSDTVNLSSGQRARFQAWSEAQAIPLNEDLITAGAFRVSDILLDGAPGPAAANEPAVPTRASAGTASPALASGLGIDIQRIDEIIPETADTKADPELRSLFTPRELSYAETRSNPRETLAGLFAAKEAIVKCDPTVASSRPADIEILPDASGKPGHAGFVLSISHSGAYAIAVAAKAGAGAPPPPRPPGVNEPSAVAAPSVAPEPQRKPKAKKHGLAARVIAAIYHLVVFAGAVCFVLLALDRFLGTHFLA